MVRFLITDYDYPELEPELRLYREAGVAVRTGRAHYVVVEGRTATGI